MRRNVGRVVSDRRERNDPDVYQTRFATGMCSFGATPFGMFASLAINIVTMSFLMTQLICFVIHGDAGIE